MRKHTGERPHKYSYCEKALYIKNHLEIHSKIDIGEKPYLYIYYNIIIREYTEERPDHRNVGYTLGRSHTYAAIVTNLSQGRLLLSIL